MVIGEVRANVPYVSLELPGANGRLVHIEFILDTGYDGDLTLPMSMILDLKLRYDGDRLLKLAGGSTPMSMAYEALLKWHGEFRATEIVAIENAPLLGASLLSGSHLDIEMVDGGQVVIEPL